MNMPLILRLDRAISRSKHFGHVVAAVYGVSATVFWWIDQPTYALLCVVGLTFELNQAEIRRLRNEVRRKPMWDEGN